MSKLTAKDLALQMVDEARTKYAKHRQNAHKMNCGKRDCLETKLDGKAVVFMSEVQLLAQPSTHRLLLNLAIDLRKQL